MQVACTGIADTLTLSSTRGCQQSPLLQQRVRRGSKLSSSACLTLSLRAQELQALADTVGVVSKGLSAEAIAALPTHVHMEPQMVLRSSTRSSTPRDCTCTICCEEIQVLLHTAGEHCLCIGACIHVGAAQSVSPGCN